MNRLWGVGLFIVIFGCAPTIPDSDFDHLGDNIDQCPLQAEDLDGYQDDDGCPDYDDDQDGVPDSLDQCPLLAEDLDNFQDGDGCPDIDNDGDGILDLQDSCPNEAEDLDGYQDEDGCPDFDNDDDGIPDSLDQCPMAPEDPDDFEDQDGCAEWDNDGDGILDHFDKCPNQPETINGLDDEDGCPDEKPQPLQQDTKVNILFESQSDHLTESSRKEIESMIVAPLKTYPQDRVYLYYFMPNQGHSESAYLDLLNQRILAISNFFKVKGVGGKQVRIRTVTPELLHSYRGSVFDFEMDLPALFRRK